jgi:hypothetical protein
MKLFNVWFPVFLSVVLMLISCTFKYGEEGEPEERARLAMIGTEYTRMIAGEMEAKVFAGLAERWDDREMFVLEDFYFEYYGGNEKELDTTGGAGKGTFDLTTNDMVLFNGVFIRVASEEMEIGADKLFWNDKDKMLTAAENEDVYVKREDGSQMRGKGFWAYSVTKSWAFEEGGSGMYVYEEKEEEKKTTGNVVEGEDGPGVLWRFGDYGEDFEELENEEWGQDVHVLFLD